MSSDGSFRGAGPGPGSLDAERRADVERKVAVRRVKRRLKAVASIGLALMAGAFLACSPDKQPKERARVPVPPNPMTPSVGSVPSPPAASTDVPLPVPSGGSSPAGSTALAPSAKAPHKAPTIDRQEHRKGMPVPDNLLE